MIENQCAGVRSLVYPVRLRAAFVHHDIGDAEVIRVERDVKDLSGRRIGPCPGNVLSHHPALVRTRTEGLKGSARPAPQITSGLPCAIHQR